MHDDGSILHPVVACLVQTVALQVLFIAHIHGGSSFLLDPEHHDDIYVFDDIVQLHRRKAFSPPDFRSGKADFGTHLFQCFLVGCGNPAVQDIAADDNLQAFQGTELLVHREQVQQALCGMITLAVSGIQDGDIDVFQLFVVGVLGVADDHGVIADGLQHFDGVVEGFAFGDGTLAYIDICRLAAELQLCAFKGIVRSRRCFEKKIGNQSLGTRQLPIFEFCTEQQSIIEDLENILLGQIFHTEKRIPVHRVLLYFFKKRVSPKGWKSFLSSVF